MKLFLPLAPRTRRLAVGLWLAVAVLAMALIAVVWPEPYVFYVSQLGPVGAEEVDGKLVKLDNWEDGYAKLDAFQRKRMTAVLASAVMAAAAVLALAAGIFGGDTSWWAWLVAVAAATFGMWAIDRALPPVIDPVYGTGFQHIFPWYIELTVSLVVATFAVAPLAVLRWLVGRWRSSAIASPS
jgi:hypothetical protein